MKRDGTTNGNQSVSDKITQKELNETTNIYNEQQQQQHCSEMNNNKNTNEERVRWREIEKAALIKKIQQQQKWKYKQT